MSRALSAIGVGSGIDFGKIYDDLKKAEEDSVVKRPTKQLEKLTTRQKDLTSLTTHISNLKSSIGALRDGSAILKRNVDIAGSGESGATVGVEVSSGVNSANFKIDVKQLAQKDSYQSKVFSSKADPLFNDSDMYLNAGESNQKPFSEGAFKIKIDDETFTINVRAGDSLETLVDRMINTKSDKAITASKDDEESKKTLSDYINVRALKVSSSDEFRLVVSSKETGEKNAIKFEALNTDDADKNAFSKKLLEKLGFIDNSQYASIKDKIENTIPTLENEINELKSKYSDKLSGKTDDEIIGMNLSELQTLMGYSEDLESDTIKNEASDLQNKLKLAKTTKSEYEKLTKINDEAHISVAKDAEFEYDGVMLKRSSNQVDDVLLGANIKLLKLGESNVNISSDTGKIKEELKEFVKNYNTLVANLDAATDFNKETKSAGAFQGVSEITRIKSELASMINRVDIDKKYSLGALGFELGSNGVLTFDDTKFDIAFNKDPKGVEEYFNGKTTYTPFQYTSKSIKPEDSKTIIASGDLVINGKKIAFTDDDRRELENNEDPNKLLKILKKSIDDAKIEGLLVVLDSAKHTIEFKTDGKNAFEIAGNEEKLKALGLEKTSKSVDDKQEKGIFDEFKDLVDGYIGRKGTLTKYGETLSDDVKKIQKDKEKALKDLEGKYSTMAHKFNLYDQMITKMKSQESVLSSMINAQIAGK